MKKTKRLRNLWYRLSSNQRYWLRKLFYLPSDTFDKITGKTHKYVPPRGKIFTGSPSNAQDFLKQGELQLELLKNEIKLKPSDIVLDIGCGIGRTAIALSGYITSGSYHGFDVVEKGIDWCKKGIGNDFKNFHFNYIPLKNDLYNTSLQKAEEFIFPYREDYFDKIFTFSVFTHMGIDEIQNYLSQIERVIKKNAVCFSTFFLYDESDEKLIADNPQFSFPFKREGYRLMDLNVEAGNIALEKNKLHLMMKKANLEIVNIIDGFWKDEIKDPNKREYQDCVIFKKA